MMLSTIPLNRLVLALNINDRVILEYILVTFSFTPVLNRASALVTTCP